MLENVPEPTKGEIVGIVEDNRHLIGLSFIKDEEDLVAWAAGMWIITRGTAT